MLISNKLHSFRNFQLQIYHIKNKLDSNGIQFSIVEYRFTDMHKRLF